MGVLARQNLRAYSSPASAIAGAGRRKPVESNWRIRAIVSALFLRRYIPRWRTMRGNLRVGRCPVRPAFPTPVSFAAIPVGREATNSNVFLTGVCHV